MHSYDLTQLDANSFEHMVNFLALGVLGNGVTGFATGPDGGKDGFLEGKATYPSSAECWDGTWYIQSKFHKPHLSTDQQKWLVKEVLKEIRAFEHSEKRRLPDNWIIATNIDPTGIPETGSYEKIKRIVKKFAPKMNVDIWGGRKILDFLSIHPNVAKTYGHFLTPGHVITKLYDSLHSENEEIKSLIDHLIVNQFNELSYTKLEQAGSGGDQRPKIYELFRDLPAAISGGDMYYIMESLVSASNNVQKLSVWNNFGDRWKIWAKNPMRARVLLFKGGPGQGKSTAGQYFSQIQRAAFILSDSGPVVTPIIKDIAIELKSEAEKYNFWPTVPRIPLFIELKDYANWYSKKEIDEPKNIVEYVCHRLRIKISFDINASILRRAFCFSSWFVNFDGLDEVPNDLKDQLAKEVIEFTNEVIPTLDADVLVLCTTRPQGYSGQFEDLGSSVMNLLPLPENIALECASAVVRYNRSVDEADESIMILKAAMQSDQVKELMTTPLQAHIMAVVVRDGGRPPEKRWELFNNFYFVMKRREGLKNFPDPRISILLREKEQLLKSIHERLGICLHARAESSDGAEAMLNKKEFRVLAEGITSMLIDGDINDTVDTLMEATIERLVFVNTPESSDSVRFDIRQLQEFFSAEFIHNAVDDTEFQKRFEIICGDAHWREVVHFILSALIYHKKLSALVIASSTLLQLDDNDSENHKIRAFKRKMGIGALLSLRLLEEGVLEQDKRIRNYFTRNLSPLWSMIEFDVINKISLINKEQSLNWVLGNMIDAFFEMDFSEHIIIGHLLSNMLPDTCDRIEEIKNRLKYAPVFYWESILCFYISGHFHYLGERKCQRWFFEFAIEMYFSNNTRDCYLLNNLHRFIYTALKWFDGLRSLSLDSDKIAIIKFIFDNGDYERNDAVGKDDYNKDIYCFITLIPPVSNNEEIEVDFNYLCFDDSMPINVLKSAVCFCKNKNKDNFKNFLVFIKNNDYCVDTIPSKVRNLIPLRFDSGFIREYVDTLLSFDDAEISAYLERGVGIDGLGIPTRFEAIVLNDSPFDKDKWSKLCENYPMLALRIVNADIPRLSEMNKVKDEYVEDFYYPILKIAKKNTNIFSGFFGLWGKLFKAFPEHEDSLRKKLILCPLQNIVGLEGVNNTEPYFTIDVEKEKVFIFHLARYLLDFESTKDYFNFHHYHLIHIEYNEDYVRKFGLDNDFLIETAFSNSEDVRVRAACLSLYMSQSFSDKKSIVNYFFENQLDELFFQLVTPETKGILMMAAFCFLCSIGNYDELLMGFLGRVSILIKDNFKLRMLIQNVYQRWRERSFAVVQKSNLLEDWLNYSY